MVKRILKLMAIMDSALLSALKTKMQWHQTRQGLLAENIANASTPGYRGRDLADFDFSTMVRDSQVQQVTTESTNAMHISAANSSSTAFGQGAAGNFEITPNGNGVVLEDQMMKITGNQMDYQAVTSLYSRSVRLLKTALGRNG